jgi:hypothetical protein
LINKEIGVERIPVGISNLQEYENLFEEGKHKKFRGESSVMYLMYPEIVIPKIKDLLGYDAKIIIMLRNPIERAYSGYQHVKRYNVKEELDFENALATSEERYFTREDMTPASRYKELGLYFKQVKSFLQEMKNVHIIIYDDYQQDFQEEMNKVFAFLGISQVKINADQRHMVGGWQWENESMKKMMMKKSPLKTLLKIIIPFKSLRKKVRQYLQSKNTTNVPKMSLKTKDMLKQFYKDDVQKLSDLLNRDLNYWTT